MKHFFFTTYHMLTAVCHSMKRLHKVLTFVAVALAVTVLASCGGSGKKRFVVGMSQCSEDTWRDKLNNELRLAASFYDVDLRIK